MRPKDLKTVFSFEHRRPLIQDGVFYVPKYYGRYDEFLFPPWKTLFENDYPVCIEYCSGNGDWIVEKALKYPHYNWVAVEMRFNRVRKIWSKKKNHQLKNLFIICGEALTFTYHYVAEKTIDEIYIHFPDPWPKQRHEKHRLLKPRFLHELSRVLKQNRHVTFVTDDHTYLTQTLDNFAKLPQFKLLEKVCEETNYGGSWFEKLWREKGKKIYHSKFVCNDS